MRFLFVNRDDRVVLLVRDSASEHNMISELFQDLFTFFNEGETRLDSAGLKPNEWNFHSA